jgi:hypothetical protein
MLYICYLIIPALLAARLFVALVLRSIYGTLIGIALGYELDDWGVRVPVGVGNFSPHHSV